MPNMNDQHIAQLEARLEKLVEGVFAYVMGNRIHARDIALQMARAMEQQLRLTPGANNRPTAPDHYVISVSPDVASHIHQRYPHLPDILSQQMTELASNADYYLQNIPVIQIVADHQLTSNQLQVKAEHIGLQRDTTGILQPIRKSSAHAAPNNAQFILHSDKNIALTQSLITIGRSLDNDIILDDPYVSRYHAQVRLRFGAYMLFDTASNSGTYVNDVRIQEHRLQTGDVVRLGSTILVYMEDDTPGTATTGLLDTV